VTETLASGQKRGFLNGIGGCTLWVFSKKIYRLKEDQAFSPSLELGLKRKSCAASVCSIEIDTLEYQETEKIETKLGDVDRIRIRKVYVCCPGLPSGGS
jgi:hypothetical protein